MNDQTRRVLVVLTAAAIFVSGFIHFYLYFRGGYRGIAPDEVLGITISRSFALNAIAAVVIAEALVLSLRFERLAMPAVLAAVGFAASTLGAYFVTRTVGLLGFTDDQTSTEAIIAVAAELAALVSGMALFATLVSAGRAGQRESADSQGLVKIEGEDLNLPDSRGQHGFGRDVGLDLCG